MKKSLLLIFTLSLLILSGCVTQEDVDDLNYQVSSLENKNNDLKNTLDECNSNIEDAQSYAGSDYEDMEDALESLETCDY